MKKNNDIKVTQSTSSGWGLGSILTLIFVVLKLTGNIDWSWWWVLAPIWIPLALSLVILLFGVFLSGVGVLLEFLFKGGKK